MDHVIGLSAFMLGRWQAQENGAKHMSTVEPKDLLKNYTERGKRSFGCQLNRLLTELEKDRRMYLDEAFPEMCKDTCLKLCLRFQFCVTLLSIKRLQKEWSSLPLKYTETDMKKYFSRLLLPSSCTYHDMTSHEPFVLSDLMSTVYTTYSLKHLNALCPIGCSRGEIPGHHQGTFGCEGEVGVRIAADDYMNAVLCSAAHLASFPVLSENLKGYSVSTAMGDDVGSSSSSGSMHQIDILEKGRDNRAQSYGHLHEERVCTRCKLTNVCIGLVDVTEQRNKHACTCMVKKPDFEETFNFWQDSYAVRGAAITRLLLLSPDCCADNVGCWCPDHKELFSHVLSEHLKSAVDKCGL